MKKLSIAILMSTGIVGTSFAVPLIDLDVGVGYINLSPSGWVKYKGTQVDVKDDLKLGDSNNVNAYVQIGLPVLPNIKLEYLPTNYEGSGTVTIPFTFAGKTYTTGVPIDTKLKLDQYDLSLFYNIPLPFITPRLGLAVKYLDGYAYVKAPVVGKGKADVTAPIPMVYAGAHVSLPGIPIEADVEGKGIAYQGNSLIDIKGMGMFTLVGIPLIGKAYIGAGYRYQRLKLDDIDSLYSDIKFKGFFGEVGVSF